MSHHHAPHFLESAKKIIEGMEPLPSKKDPAVTSALGFLFGPLGVGLYLRSLSDFLWCLGLLLAFAVVLPGVGLVPGWLFSAGYGYLRASTSNEKIDHRGARG